MTGKKINSRRKGITAEQAVARYFVAHGLPDAHRAVAAGWRNGSTQRGDQGDVAGVPGFAVQVKNVAKPLVGQRLADVWRETCEQAVRAGGEPLLVEKRPGTANVGQWWLYIGSTLYIRLVTGQWQWTTGVHLVRVELDSVIEDLVLMSRELASTSH